MQCAPLNWVQHNPLQQSTRVAPVAHETWWFCASREPKKTKKHKENSDQPRYLGCFFVIITSLRALWVVKTQLMQRCPIIGGVPHIIQVMNDHDKQYWSPWWLGTSWDHETKTVRLWISLICRKKNGRKMAGQFQHYMKRNPWGTHWTKMGILKSFLEEDPAPHRIIPEPSNPHHFEVIQPGSVNSHCSVCCSSRIDGSVLNRSES